MLKYAREDTHYLLFIYDEMRKKIIESSKENNLGPIECLKSVLNKSKTVCMKTYKKPTYKNEAYYNILSRNKPILSRKKYLVLKALYKWRDDVARLEDENPGFILPVNLFFDIIDLNPKTPQEIFSKVRKLSYVARKYMHQFIEEIQKIDQKLEEEKTAEDKISLEGNSVLPVQPAIVPTKLFKSNINDSDLSEAEKFKFKDVNTDIGFSKVDQSQEDKLTHDFHAVKFSFICIL